MIPSLTTYSRKGIDAYDCALRVHNPIETVIASFKGMGISLMTLDYIGSQEILHYNTLRLQSEIHLPLRIVFKYTVIITKYFGDTHHTDSRNG